MRRAGILFILFLVIMTTFAQPGMCPCWLMPNVEEVHLHYPRQAETQHDHEYLLEMFNANAFEILRVMLVPSSLLLTLIFTTAVSREFPLLAVVYGGWQKSPPTPPPRSA
jgi:hypothetical protein